MKTPVNPGIKDIARLAGVSIGTVDRALHNRGRVAPETKRRVEEIARQVNYKPNLLARSLAKKSRITVAILVPDPVQDEYWQQAWSGFESLLSIAEHQGIQVRKYFYSLDNHELFCKYAGQITVEKPDGLIMAPNYLDCGLKLFRDCGKASIPVIVFDTNLPEIKSSCFIGTDLYQSGLLCAQLLEMITHRQGDFAIFHIGAPLSDSYDMLEKEKGFNDYIEGSGSGRVCLSFTVDGQRNLEAQLDEAFENNIAGCFVSTSKTWLIGEYLKKRGKAGIRLVGFDLIRKNIELLKEGWIDLLINQNPQRQARKSLNAFINHFAFNEVIKEDNYFPLEIITKSNIPSV
jgi:LacI family transcriptional regulator